MTILFEQTRELLHSLTEVVCYFQNQEKEKAIKILKQVIDLLQTFIESLGEIALKSEALRLFNACQKITEGLLNSQEEQWITMHIQKGLIPILFEVQENVFGQSDEILKDYWGENRLFLRKKNRELYRDLLVVRDDISDEYQLSWAKTGDLVLEIGRAHV